MVEARHTYAYTRAVEEMTKTVKKRRENEEMKNGRK
jgi:hypothetical protein